MHSKADDRRQFNSALRLASTRSSPRAGIRATGWDGPHVGKRLVEGLRTLMLMPMPRGPRAFGGHWPAYAHDWADLLAQQEADAEQKQRDQREANRTRLRPSSIEIAHMEQAICWPARYLHSLPQLVRTVKMVAAGRSRDRDMEHAARRLRFPGASCGAGTARVSI